MRTGDEAPINVNEIPIDVNELLEQVKAKAAEAGDDTPEPLMQGTFAMYPMPDGGVMVVSHVPAGPMEGTHHHRIPPGLIRVGATLMGGTAAKRISALNPFGRKRRAIGDGG